jgi:hypothetical protein
MSFLPFEEARALVRELGLESQEQWQEWRRDAPRPANIPSSPERTYKDMWVEWLGFGEGEPKSDEFLAFEEAREVVQEVGLGSQKEWKAWSRDCRPADVPGNPNVTYADEGWVSWKDWLGDGEGQPPRR